MRSRLLARDDVDKEVEHVRLGEGSSNVASLECTSFVVFCMDPGAHCEFRDEDVATFGEENGSFCRDHLDFGVRLHDLLDASKG